jgi:hypothetical protein
MATIEVRGIEEVKRNLAKLSAAVAPLGGASLGRGSAASAQPRRSTFVNFPSNDCLEKRPGSARDVVWLARPSAIRSPPSAQLVLAQQHLQRGTRASIGSTCGSGCRVTTIGGLHSSWHRFINGLVEAQGWLGWWGCTQPLARKCQGLPISVEVLDGSPPSPPSRDHFPPSNPAVRAVCAPQCHRADAHVAMRSEPIAESPGVKLAAAKRGQLDCLP